MNLVVIVSDTVRCDHLSCYGSTIVKTPNLDWLAAKATLFERCYAANFPTVPARGTLLLGKWTFNYRGWEPLGKDEVTVTELLAIAGYTTVGVVDTPFYVLNAFDHDRGFKYFYDLDCHRYNYDALPVRNGLIPRPRGSEYDYAAPRTVALAEKCLEHIYDQPFFLFVDMWDPHEPWDPPAYYVKPFKPDYDGRTVYPCYGYWEKAGLTRDDIETAHACYCGEMVMVDRWIGRLLERIDSLGIADETAIVFVSDHGFNFGERGLFGKMVRPAPKSRAWLRSPLYEEVARVPLLVHVPGQAPRRVKELVSLADVMPTLLDIAGLPVPDRVQGRSVLPIVAGGTGGGHDIVVTSMPLTNPGQPVRVVDAVLREVGEYQPATITADDWSLLYSAAGESIELYHLASDPGQTRNVAADRPDVVRDLHARYVSLLEKLGTSPAYLEPRSRL